MVTIVAGMGILYRNRVVILICFNHTFIVRCEKMKMMRKMIAIWKILLMVVMPDGVAEASVISGKEKDKEYMSVIFTVRRFIMLLYLKMILNMKTLLYNESYIYYYNIERTYEINALV